MVRIHSFFVRFILAFLPIKSAQPKLRTKNAQLLLLRRKFTSLFTTGMRIRVCVFTERKRTLVVKIYEFTSPLYYTILSHRFQPFFGIGLPDCHLIGNSSALTRRAGSCPAGRRGRACRSLAERQRCAGTGRTMRWHRSFSTCGGAEGSSRCAGMSLPYGLAEMLPLIVAFPLEQVHPRRKMRAGAGVRSNAARRESEHVEISAGISKRGMTPFGRLNEGRVPGGGRDSESSTSRCVFADFLRVSVKRVYKRSLHLAGSTYKVRFIDNPVGRSAGSASAPNPDLSNCASALPSEPRSGSGRDQGCSPLPSQSG